MATYYVKQASDGGSDGAAGTSAATAWATIGKALGASGIASGDTVYIAPGTYREVVTVAMTSATVETKIYGDPSASQFSGITPGEVVWTAYTTNDKTTPSTTVLLTLAGRDFLTFQDMVWIGANAFSPGVIDASTATSTDITLRRVTIIGSYTVGTTGSIVLCTVGANVAANWLIDTCQLFGNGRTFNLTLTRPATADFDANFTIQNSLLVVARGVLIGTTGANTFKPGGVRVTGCTWLVGLGDGLATNDANCSTTIPCSIKNSYINCFNGIPAFANTAGQITEDYNVLVASTPRSNVTAGTHSGVGPTYASMLDFGQSWLHGFAPRPFLSPMPGSPVLGLGDDGTFVATDALSRPRPAGGNSTSKGVGYLERHDTAAKETTTTDAGSVGLVLLGPSDQDIRIPVDAAATTVTVKMRYDSTHAATNKPQAILLDNAAIGVTTQTVTMTAAVDTWETLTIGPFTPTAKGVVVVRLVGRSAAAGGKAFADTVAVS